MDRCRVRRGRVNVITDDEMLEMVKKYLPEYLSPENINLLLVESQLFMQFSVFSAKTHSRMTGSRRACPVFPPNLAGKRENRIVKQVCNGPVMTSRACNVSYLQGVAQLAYVNHMFLRYKIISLFILAIVCRPLCCSFLITSISRRYIRDSYSISQQETVRRVAGQNTSQIAAAPADAFHFPDIAGSRAGNSGTRRRKCLPGKRV